MDGNTAGFPVDLTVSIKGPWGSYKEIKTLTDIPGPKGKAFPIELYTVIGYHQVRHIRIEVTKLGLPVVAEPGMYQLQLAETEFVPENGDSALGF
ncbi:MAG: hypothetical protein ABGX16_17620 [Pirellulales bacterium]